VRILVAADKVEKVKQFDIKKALESAAKKE
jgi:hypothetical protein